MYSVFPWYCSDAVVYAAYDAACLDVGGGGGKEGEGVADERAGSAVCGKRAGMRKNSV